MRDTDPLEEQAFALDPGTAVQQLQIIGGAMILGLVLMAGAFAFVRQQADPMDNPELEILGLVAIVLAMGGFVTSFVLGPLLVKSATSQDDIVAKFRMATILRYAMNEAGGLLGGVAYFLTGKLETAGLAIGISLVGLALSLPRLSQLEHHLRGDEFGSPA